MATVDRRPQLLGYVHSPLEGLVMIPLHPAHSLKVIDDESNIEALMPKLRHSCYYTKPTIEELAAKERESPGHCGSIRGFVMGRDGVGSIKFLGTTDLRWLDLESFITFDDGCFTARFEKPHVTLEYTRTAEITLLVKEVTDVQTLITKTCDSQKGIKYVSYDPINGEVKFRVKYFSSLGRMYFYKPRSLMSRVMRWLILD